MKNYIMLSGVQSDRNNKKIKIRSKSQKNVNKNYDQHCKFQPKPFFRFFFFDICTLNFCIIIHNRARHFKQLHQIHRTKRHLTLALNTIK